MIFGACQVRILPSLKRVAILDLQGISSSDTRNTKPGFSAGYLFLCKRKENYHLGIGYWYIRE